MKPTEVRVEEYHIVLNREQLRTIAAGLNELPYKVAAPLLVAIQQQVSDEERRELEKAALNEELSAGKAEAEEPDRH